jgi:hypothetical protein
VDHNFLDWSCIRRRLNKSRESTLHPINADLDNKFRFDKLRSGQLGNAARWRATYKRRRSRVAGAWTSVRIPTFNFNDGTAWRLGVRAPKRYFCVCTLTGGGRVAWIVRLVKTGADGEKQSDDVMKINRPDDLGDIANLGLPWPKGNVEERAGSEHQWQRRRGSKSGYMRRRIDASRADDGTVIFSVVVREWIDVVRRRGYRRTTVKSWPFRSWRDRSRSAMWRPGTG